MTKLAIHFRIELNDEELEIFLDHLPSWSDYQIETAFDRCFTACMFFPKLREVLDLMPEQSHGPMKTCAHCEPDGWRLIISPTAGPPYRAVIRCDHKDKHPLDIDPNNPAHDFKLLYKNPPEWATKRGLPSTDRAPIVKNPRWPHLIGKGILYGENK